MLKYETSSLILGICIVFLSALPPNVLSQSAREVRTLETVKKLSAGIDQYVRDHKKTDLKFLARKGPTDFRPRKVDSWEWKEVKSWDETEAYFKDYWSFLSVGVCIKDSQIAYVNTGEWSGSGDWAFYVSYYYDDKGRLLQIATDFRSATDKQKVLDFQYFDEYGGVFDHVIEYYDMLSEQKLAEKPDMQIKIHEIPIYLRVADLPVYPLLKVGLPKRNR